MQRGSIKRAYGNQEAGHFYFALNKRTSTHEQHSAWENFARENLGFISLALVRNKVLEKDYKANVFFYSKKV